jgi:hypothetical protein
MKVSRQTLSFSQRKLFHHLEEVAFQSSSLKQSQVNQRRKKRKRKKKR